MGRKLLVAFGIFISILLGLTVADASAPCVRQAYGGSKYIICTFDLRAYHIRLFWKDEKGQPYASFDHLPGRLNGDPIVFAMNAGMYQTDLSPLGLYVEKGRTMRQVNTANGIGNFYLKPNGIFYISGEKPGILTTDRFVAQRPKVEFATQSGPMLVIGKQINQRIRPRSTSSKIRNGVGVRNNYIVVFAISEEPVSFWQFATLFRDHIGARDALFLDGSISSLYAPSLRRRDTLYPMGPIVAGFARKSSTN